MASHRTENRERLLIGVLVLATFTIVSDVSKHLSRGRTDRMLRSEEIHPTDEPAWGFHAASPSTPQAPSFAPANKPQAQAFEIRAFELRYLSTSTSTNGTNVTTDVPTPLPTALPTPSPSVAPSALPTEGFASGDSVYVSAASTMTTDWSETRAKFNHEYTGPFKSAMVNSSGYLTELSQVTNAYANATASTRRKLLSTVSIDVSFTITIDLTSLGLTASDATSAVTTFTSQLLESMNATGASSFASKFTAAVAAEGLTSVTLTPDVSATASTLKTMTSSITVVTQSPTPSPTDAGDDGTAASPTTGPTTSVITTSGGGGSGAADLMPSYLMALICVCPSVWVMFRARKPKHTLSMDRRREISFHVRLRPIAILYSVVFLIVMLLGLIVTFTATRYTEHTDKIFEFYGAFNPCIFFDHYPASIVSLTGIILFISISIIYSTILFVFSYIVFPLGSFSMVAICSFLMCLADILLPNVFGVDLYSHGYTDYSRNHDHEHGNSTATLTHDEMADIGVHTAWYIQWLVANIVFMLLLLRVMRLVQPEGNSVIILAAYGTAILGLVVAILNMALSITLGPEWQRSPETFMQHVIKALGTALKVSAWHWIPVLFHRISIPGPVGLVVTIRAHDGEAPGSLGDKNVGGDVVCRDVTVAGIIGGAFRVLAVACLGVYCFSDPDIDSGTLVPLASGFRLPPYTYVFMPCWVVFILLIAVAALVHAIRLELDPLLRSNQAAKLANITASMGLVAGLVCCSWVIVPRFQNTAGPAVFVMVALPLWFIGVNGWPPPWQHKLFVVAMIGLIAGSPFAVAVNVLLCILLSLYDFCVPPARPVDIILSVTGGPAGFQSRVVPNLAGTEDSNSAISTSTSELEIIEAVGVLPPDKGQSIVPEANRAQVRKLKSLGCGADQGENQQAYIMSVLEKHNYDEVEALHEMLGI